MAGQDEDVAGQDEGRGEDVANKGEGVFFRGLEPLGSNSNGLKSGGILKLYHCAGVGG